MVVVCPFGVCGLTVVLCIYILWLCKCSRGYSYGEVETDGLLLGMWVCEVKLLHGF